MCISKEEFREDKTHAKIFAFRRMSSSGMFRLVVLVGADVSEKFIDFIFRVKTTKIFYFVD
jgi:hypothetical protein